MTARHLPSVHQVLEHAAARLPDYPHARLVETARAVLAEARATVDGAAPPLPEIVELVCLRAAAARQPTLRPVVNASGIILQTNLGRAPLGQPALDAIQAVAAGYANIEYDLAAGARGSRSAHLADQLRRLTGAEDALVVNNAAAALFLALSALCAGREVLVSRGQAVEIGGGFRIPDILRQSGAILADVGTTNRTYAQDYARAAGERTAALLRVHSSNFRLQGFVHEPELADLARVARDAGLLLIDDLGSGALLDTARFGLAAEPLVQHSVADGADLVIFSGDKLLGGPQAGIIAGRAAPIAALRQHPLLRALRVDKLTIAGLAATLRAYEENTALRDVPVWEMISAPLDGLRERAARLRERLAPLRLAIADSQSAVGGGSLPGMTQPSVALAIEAPDLDRAAAKLRQADPPVIGRIHQGRLLLDLRTVLSRQDDDLARGALTLGRQDP